jgi:hypothetical protein
MKIKLSTLSFADSQFRVQSSCTAQPMSTDFEYSNQLSLESYNIISILVEEEWTLGGQQAVMLVNEDFGHLDKFSLYTKHRNKCENAANV